MKDTTMNATQSLIAAIVLTAAAAGSALAQEATPDSWLQGVQSSKSRADVRAELTAARQSGVVNAWNQGYIEPARSTALRATVKASTLQAIQTGEQRAINAEVYSYLPAGTILVGQAAK
jgi:Domain of unknown function (DUF4148)